MTKNLAWVDASEYTAGLMLAKRLSKHASDSRYFAPPYDEAVKLWQDGKDIEEIFEAIGPNPIQGALHAQENINGLGDIIDFPKLLQKSFTGYQAGIKLEKLAQKLQSGEQVDLSKIKSILNDLNDSKTDLTPLIELEGIETPFKKSGWKPIDDHLGGLPEIGLVTVGGNPGVGKTTFAAKLVAEYLIEHKDENAGIFSLEMMKNEIAMRIREVKGYTRPEKLEDMPEGMKDFESRFFISELVLSPEDVINKSATLDNLGLIVIDFADYMIQGEVTESAMAHIYRTLAIGAKELRCTIVLLAQLNRNYTGGVPRPYHIRYTSLAEALSYMILMLYNPTKDYFSEDSEQLLPIARNKSYIVAWKMRGGFRLHKEDNPGAICVPFRGDRGWGNTSQWFSLQKGL